MLGEGMGLKEHVHGPMASASTLKAKLTNEDTDLLYMSVGNDSGA